MIMSENSEERPPQSAKPEPNIPEPKPAAEDGDWLRLSALAPELPSSSFPRDQPTTPLPIAPLSCPSRETRVESVPTIPGYQILGVLGRGGMGLVYQARQIALNRIVALKMIRTGGDPAAEIARFREEALAVAALRHPNIIGIFAIDQFNDTPFFTMEFAEGGSLAQSAAHRPQPPDYAVEMVQTLALAVQAAHDQGIVHRDLKPANVLLDGSGRPKVSDFGASKRMDADSHPTETGQILGTPSYMSPEQAGGKRDQIGPLSDVYSLGAILYELLTGRPPFQATEAHLTIAQVLAAEPIPPSRVHAGIRRDLETICLKCLRKSPADRYSSASALADDLQRFRDGKPILARRTSRLERVGRWVRRKPREAAVVAGIAVF
jgi:serine/threonine protein kinase